jgi:hypothetical protein
MEIIKKMFMSRWLLTIIWFLLSTQQIEQYGFVTRTYCYIALTIILFVSVIRGSFNKTKKLN